MRFCVCSRSEGDAAFFGQHLEVGAGHLGETAVVDASAVGSDHPLVNGDRTRRRHRAQVIDGLGNLHPWGRRGSGQHVYRLVGHEQCVTGMHQPGAMFAVVDQIRNVFYHRDFRMDYGVLAADGPHGQLPDLQLVTNVHRLPRRAELRCGLRIGIRCGVRVVFEQRRQPRAVDVVGVLVGEEDGGQPRDSLETVREGAGIKKHAGVVELGKKAGMAEMRQLHVYDCALTGVIPMRVILATMLVVGGIAVALVVVVPVQAEPETCPPVCDQIPNTAWIQQRAVPLDSTYRGPALAGLAVALTGTGPGAAAGPRFRFEDLCATPAVPHDARDSAVSARATVVQPDGQWQLQALVLHWRGDTANGGPTAASVFRNAVAALRGCQRGAPAQSPSITSDEPNRMAAVISGPVVMHTYLVAHVASSTVSELTLWSSGPPEVPWPAMADDSVLNSMTAPLCDAYIASCP